MKERDFRGFKDQRFRVSGRDLDVYGGHIFIHALTSLIAGVALSLILVKTVKALFGDFEGWGELGVWGFLAPISLATSWGVFFLGKPRLGRWLEERRVPPEGGADEAAEAA